MFLSSSNQSISGINQTSSNPVLSPFTSPTCSIQFLKDTDKKPFRELLLMGLPILVHPVIILRLLAHKMFGNMIRRKSLFNESKPETKLKPPVTENLQQLDMCPPRASIDLGVYRTEAKREAFKRKKANLHVSITKSSSEDLDSPIGLMSPADKPCVKQNGINVKNGTTQCAIRVIGQSLVNPFDPGLLTQQQSNDSAGISSSDSSGEVKQAGMSRLFHWPSKKHLCKSQSNVSSGGPDTANVSLDKTESKSSVSSSVNDVDIIKFQRDLINLPTFVMDTPMNDVSPIFSRSSSVPENLASRMSGNDSTTPDLSLYGSDHFHFQRSRNSEDFESAQALRKVPHSPSMVTITTTDFTTSSVQGQGRLALSLQNSSTSTDGVDDTMANVTVRFVEAPPSPLSSASQSPQAFDFSVPYENCKLTVNSNSIPSSNVQTIPSGATLNTGNFLIPSPTSAASSTMSSNFSTGSPWSPSSPPQPIQSSNSAFTDIPMTHRGVFSVIETWISICANDLDCSSLIVHEMRDFLRKMSILGHEYKSWCQKIQSKLSLEVSILNFFSPFSHDKLLPDHLKQTC